MNLIIDENEALHIHSCLIVGNDKFAKAKKDLEKLEQNAEAIDEQIQINAKLRRIFNPRAEEEARAKDRRDPAQMDLSDVPSSGETGGGIPAGQTFRINTGEPKTITELRDDLLECGVAVYLADVEAWSDDERRAASEFIDRLRDGTVDAATIAEPECVERHGTTVARLQELLAAGPYRVGEMFKEEGGTDFAVVREQGDDEIIVDEAYDDKLDAEIRAARLNKTELQRADMSEDDILEWSGKGPWTPELVSETESVIVAGTQREACENFHDAMGRAARYNRQIAQRAENDRVASEQRAEAAVEQEVEIVAVAGADSAD